MPVVSTGQITIVDVNDGLDVSLSANGIALAADTAGTVSSFAGAETTMLIREAGVDTTSTWSFYISATGGGISYRDSDDTVDRTGTGPINGQMTGTPGYVKVAALSQDLSYLDITAVKGTNTVVRRFSVAKARQGSSGTRGTITTSAATSGASWVDSEATAAISAAGGGSPIQGDVVTLYNTAQSFSQTRVRSSGGTWSPLTAFFGGDVIVDNTLSASKIVAGSISSDRIAAGAITASKIAVGDFAVQARNWNFEEGDTQWTKETGWTVVSDAVNAKSGSWVAKAQGAVAGQRVINSQQVPVTQGEAVYLECFVKFAAGSAGTAGAHVAVVCRDAAGTILSPQGGWGTTYGNIIDVATTAYTKSSLQFVIPAGVAFVSVCVAVAGMTSGTAYVDEVRMFRASSATLIADGAITTDKISAGAITASKIAAGSITATNVVVSDNSNYYPDYNFDDLSFYTVSPGSVLFAAVDSANQDHGSRYINVGTAGTSQTVTTGWFSVEPLTEYYIGASGWSSSTFGSLVTVHIQLGSVAGSTVTAGAEVLVSSRANSTDQSRQYISYTTGSTEKRARFVMRRNTVGSARFAGLLVQRKSAGNLIVDGAISAAKIAAGSITSSKIAIGDFQNLCPNPSGETGVDGWSSTVIGPNTGIGGLPATVKSLRIINRDAYIGPWFDVTPGDQFYLSGSFYPAQAGENPPNADAAVMMRFADDVSGTNSVWLTSAYAARATNSWQTVEGNVTVPAGKRFAMMALQINGTVGFTGSWHFRNIQVRRRNSGALIVDGAITAAKISAGAITTDKLLVTGRGAALNGDPNTQDISAWSGGNISIVADATSPSGSALSVISTGATTLSTRFPLDASKNYNLRMSAKTVSGSATTYLLMAFFDGSDQLLSAVSDPANWPNNGTYHYFGLVGSGAPANYTEYQVSFGPGETFNIPAGAKYGRVGMLANFTGGSGEQRFTSIRLAEKTSADLIVDGAITANKIAANAIAVGTAAIQNGAIVNAMLGDATIQTAKIADGAITTAKIGDAQITNAKINDLDAGKITAGTISAERIGASSITAGKIDSRGLDIKDASGNVVFSSGAGSAVSAASGQLRIQYPGGGSLNSDASSIQGAIWIILPQAWSSTMMRFEVEIYEYTTGSVQTYEVGGYTYSDTVWRNTHATYRGMPGNVRRVIFGYDNPTGRPCIAIGGFAGTWSYPKITIKNFLAGYSNFSESQWSSGWSVSFQTSRDYSEQVAFEKPVIGGAFSGLDQITSTNVSTYIANAAIQTAQIANASITTAQIADASITTAKIGDAQISTAKIGDLNVTTLKIADNAVTIPVITQSSTVQTGSITAMNPAWTQNPSPYQSLTIITHSFTSSGSLVRIDLQAEVAFTTINTQTYASTCVYDGEIQVNLDSSLIATFTVNSVALAQYTTSPYVYVDLQWFTANPSVGAHTITLVFRYRRVSGALNGGVQGLCRRVAVFTTETLK